MKILYHRQSINLLLRWAYSLFSLLMVTACALGPDYRRPTIEVAEHYRIPHAEGESIANLPWWELFQDKVLQQLIRQALQENKDLKRAIASIEEHQARLSIARMDFAPQLETNINAPVIGRMGGFPFPGFATPFNYFGQVNLNWEIDIWGRIRRSTQAALAELVAQEANRRAIVLSLVGAVAQSYFDLLQLDKQLELAQQILHSWEESVAISDAQLQHGLISKLENDQLQAERANAAARVAVLGREMVQKENELSLLLGKSPNSVLRGSAITEQWLSPEIPAGLPSELLDRRPDILRDEQVLAAATARIGATKAARLPRISLTGFLGVASPSLSNLLLSNSQFGVGGLGLAAPILNARALGFEQKAVEAQAKQALAQYEQTALIAFKEVEDALVAIRTVKDQYKANQEQVKALQSALQIADLRYQSGLTSYVDVLLAKRSLFDAEIALALTQRFHLVALVQLYKALGGGWAP